MLVWLAGDVTDKWRHKTALAGIGGMALIITLGVLAFRQVGFWRDTLTLFTHTAAVTTNNTVAHNTLGICYSDTGDFDRAVREFETVLKIDGRNIIALYNIAKGLDTRGKVDEAIEYYNRVLEVAPGDADTYVALVMIESDRKNFERAKALCRTGLGYHPESGDLHGRYGSLLLQTGSVDEAIAELETAAKLKSDSAIYGTLGQALSSKGLMEKAIECYKRAIRINPENAEAHYNLGNIYLALKRPEEAEDEYEKAIKARPNFANAYSNLGVAFVQRGKIYLALDRFLLAAELDPNNAEARLNLTTALAGKGSIDEAIAHYRKVVTLFPRNTNAGCWLAALLLQKGQPEQAIAEYERILKIDSNNAEAQAGLQKAKETHLAAGRAETAEKNK
jgi:tetratricopeptide (TPR) repeat protein